jgi:phospholipase/carboxylesterase
MLQSTDFGVLAIGKTDAPVLSDSFGVSESTEQKLRIELDFGVKTKPADSKNGTDTTSAPHHILVAPVHYEAGYSYPLFVWLHDSCCDERQLLRIMPQISLRNYVAVAPRGKVVAEPTNADSEINMSTDWDDFSITSLLKQANRHKTSYNWFLDSDGLLEAERSVFDSISVAQKGCNIASNRIFIGGSGSGGTMAMYLALLYPEYFAGVAAFGALMPQNACTFCHWSTARKLSVFLGLDQSGKMSPESISKMLELFYSAGFKLTAREYLSEKNNKNTDPPQNILQEVNRWMMKIVCDEKEKKYERTKHK